MYKKREACVRKCSILINEDKIKSKKVRRLKNINNRHKSKETLDERTQRLGTCSKKL